MTANVSEIVSEPNISGVTGVQNLDADEASSALLIYKEGYRIGV